MRPVIIAVVCMVVLAVSYGTAHSVGYRAVGKEACQCPRLVARGVVPDTLNLLKEAVFFPGLVRAVDRVAMDLRFIVSQFGRPPVTESSESTAGNGEVKTLDDKSATQEKPAKEEVSPAEKTKKPKEQVKKPSKPKKRVKVPPRSR